MDYELAKPSDSDDVIHLLATVFSQSDPPAVAMALSSGEMEQFLRPIVSTVIPLGLTVIARSRTTPRLAGVLLTDDFASPPAADPSQITPKLLPILSMLETLDRQFKNGRVISPGEYLHLFMLGVDAKFAGQGIAQGLVRTCLDNGLRQGYRSAVTEATGKVSQHIFRKNGFVDRFSVAYADFVYERKRVFASIHEHDHAILMERALS